ncbi:hypothetical protein ACETU7_32975 [Rhodococcus sp. 3Y1]
MIAADVGGLGVAVRNGETGLLVQGHRTEDWAGALESLVTAPTRLAELAAQAPRHAENFSWEHTADGLLELSQSRSQLQQRNRSQRLLAPPCAGLWRLRRTGECVHEQHFGHHRAGPHRA